MPRLLFEKVGMGIWISHLDLMRVFQRSFRRAGIAIKFSKGYTPRAHVSIALPLSVGIESRCEILEFDFAEGAEMPLEDLPAALNATMPEGVHILKAWDGGKKLRDLAFLDAKLYLEYDRPVTAEMAQEIQAYFQPETPILVMKKSKRGPEEANIRPMIHKVEAEPVAEDTICLSCRVSAQNPSLNPSLLATALEVYRPELAPSFVRVQRVEILDPEGIPFR